MHTTGRERVGTHTDAHAHALTHTHTWVIEQVIQIAIVFVIVVFIFVFIVALSTPPIAWWIAGSRLCQSQGYADREIYGDLWRRETPINSKGHLMSRER